jgi:hypothetical protein
VNIKALALIHTHGAVSWDALKKRYMESSDRRTLRFVIFDKTNEFFREGTFSKNAGDEIASAQAFDQWAASSSIKNNSNVSRTLMVYQPQFEVWDRGMLTCEKF